MGYDAQARRDARTREKAQYELSELLVQHCTTLVDACRLVLDEADQGALTPGNIAAARSTMQTAASTLQDANVQLCIWKATQELTYR